MNIPRVIQGKWWLSTNPKVKLPGTLSIDENHIKLDLIGRFAEKDTIVVDLHSLYGLTHLNRQVSILGAIQISSEGPMGGKGGISTFQGSKAIIGVHVESDDKLILKSLVFHPSNFDKWLWEFPIKTDLFKAGRLTTKYKEPKTRTYKVDDDLEISFFYHLGPISHSNEVKIKATALVSIERSNETSARILYEDALHLSHFLAIATMAPVYVEDIVGYVDNGDKYPLEVEIILLYNRIEVGELHPVWMLFHFKSISKRIAGMLEKWFQKRELLRPISDLFFGNLYQQEYSSVQVFLNYIQALETYHSRNYTSKVHVPKAVEKNLKKIYSEYPKKTVEWLKGRLAYTKGPSLAYRLEKLIKHNNRQVAGRHGDISHFITEVKDTRNYYVHYNAKDEKKAAKGGKLRGFSATLGMLLEGFILEETGFTLTEVKEMQYKRRRLPGLWY